jgi:hypothetical protein
MADTLYRYTTKDADKNVEISFLIPPETNIKKHLKIVITRDTISVHDSRTSQPIILGKLYDIVVDHSYSKLEVIKNGEKFGEVEIILEKKNRNSFWPLLITNSKSEPYTTKEIDDQSEFLLAIANKTRDPAFAIVCLTNSAEKGNENALFEYATHSSGIPEWKLGINTSTLSMETDLSKTLKYYERFLDFHPYQYLVNYRVGFIYKNRQDYVKAKQHLLQSFQRHSTGYPEAALALAQILLEENDERQAIAYYRFAFEGGLMDQKLDALLMKLKKEQEEKVATIELKKKQEAEEAAAEQKRLIEAKEAEDLRILKEIESTNKMYAFTIGALVVGGAIAAGVYLQIKNNPK